MRNYRILKIIEKRVTCYILCKNSKYAPFLIDDSAERLGNNLVYSFLVEFLQLKWWFHTIALIQFCISLRHLHGFDIKEVFKINEKEGLEDN